jgi:arylsulfatase
MKTFTATIIGAIFASVGAAALNAQENGSVRTKTVEGFGGVIAERYEDSQEWWPPEELPEPDAPNIIIFLLDDVGFSQVGSFGGLIETPNIDSLASNGLRFNNFHTTALIQLAWAATL